MNEDAWRTHIPSENTVFMFHRSRTQKGMPYDAFDANLSIHGGVPKQFFSMKDHTFADWEIPPWELTIFEDRMIGQGSFAKVFMAKWRETEVVAKVLDTAFIREKKHVVLREIDIMSKLHHPNVVQFFGYVNDPFVIVLEYVPNRDLESKMGHLRMNTKINITRDILKGLIYIHNRKPLDLIHRDIKPSNVLLTRYNVAKISDFGLSKFDGTPLSDVTKCVTDIHEDTSSPLVSSGDASQSLAHATMTNNVGTYRYMSPEMKQRAEYDKRTDIYSCGVLLYELFEGKRYSPSKGMKWFWCPKKLRCLICESMLCVDKSSRWDAIQILKQFNRIMKR